MATHPENDSIKITRRRILQFSPIFFLLGCDATPRGKMESVLLQMQQFNDWVQSKVFDPEQLSPEMSDSELTPEEGFRVNNYGTDEPNINFDQWGLEIGGLVEKPGTYSLEEIINLPKKIMNTKHCCVEGWSINVKWGGTPLKKFLMHVGADLKAKYLYAECGDGYYTSYDMPSALHPQTILCYEAYHKPLDLKHGAPVRITMPTKLGYKSAKWLNKLIVTNNKPGGYWEDQGYDWFAGI